MPFIPAIGAALIGTGAGTLATSIVGAGVIGAGAYATSKLFGSINAPKTTQAPFNRNTQAVKDLSDAQNVASEDAAAIVRRRRRAGTQTVFTNPLGIDDQANISRKKLLGE